MTSDKAKTIATSQWMHIQCWSCEKWWAVEDGNESEYFCTHCGKLNEVGVPDAPKGTLRIYD